MNAPIPSGNRSTALLFGVLGLLIFLFRWGLIVWGSDSFVVDPDAYRSIAATLHETGVFGMTTTDGRVKPTAFRPPLYPVMLSWFFDSGDHRLRSSSLALAHAVLGCLSSLGAAWIFLQLTILQRANSSEPMERASESTIPRGIILASAIVALDPILLRQSQLLMTETLAVFLTVAAACVLTWSVRSNSIPNASVCLGSGVMLGLGTMCRPATLVWGILICFVFALIYRPWKQSRPALRSLVLLIAGFLFCVLPWAWRNAQAVDRWTFTTTHGGYTLLLANNPSLYEHLQRTWSRNWDDTTFQDQWRDQSAAGRSEREQDQYANNLAWKTIREQPFDFVKSCFVRELWLWAPWPNQSNWQTQAVIGTWYSILYCLSLCGGWQLAGVSKHNASIRFLFYVLLALMLSIAMVHGVYWSNMRMRAVCIPGFAVFSAWGYYCLPWRHPVAFYSRSGSMGHAECESSDPGSSDRSRMEA